MMSLSSKYYVYEYIRLDTNEPFYIGKGKGRRWKEFNDRNNYFTNIVNKIPVAVTILHDNLDQDTAFEYECWYIWQLRDIQGYYLVNETDGGEGVAGYRHTDEYKLWQSKKSKGDGNGMYGRKHSEKAKEKQGNSMRNKKHKESSKIKMRNSHLGDKNPMFGKEGALTGLKGESHPMFGKGYLIKGEKNGMSKRVILVDKNNSIIKTFNTVTDCKNGEWRKEFPKPNGIKYVEKCLKEKLEFHGFYLKYEEEVTNE